MLKLQRHTGQGRILNFAISCIHERTTERKETYSILLVRTRTDASGTCVKHLRNIYEYYNPGVYAHRVTYG